MKSIIQKLTGKTILSKVGLLIGFLWLGMASLWAQAEETATAAPKADMSQTEWLVVILFSLVVITMVFILIALMYLTMVLRMVLLQQKGDAATEEDRMTLWQRINHSLTQSVPLNREKTILLDHNYDGIKELDNHLPPWWLYLFYISIVFAIVYMLNYHVFNISPLPADEYVAEMKQAEADIAAYKEKAGNSITEENVALTTAQADLDAGKAIFEKECAACHGKAGEGGVGPNLTDEFWLHGGGIKDVFSTIKYGIPEKGMISWEKKLKPNEMQNIASYILNNLQGTNPPNAKEPQGDKYVPEEGEGGDEISMK